MPFFSPVRMREADSRTAEYHLLEELAKPQASLNAARISVFVYHDLIGIREVVVAGHAESVTCLSATSILIEAAKSVGSDVEWMLTCGAAYFRVMPPDMGMATPASIDTMVESQNALRAMIRALQEVADDKGLIAMVHEQWQHLAEFREAFGRSMSARGSEIVLPPNANGASVIDYVPIIPGSDPAGPPLRFRLEGWEFDCPGFQAVADRHLRKVRRELLRDAMRRRRTYRGWLKEWMEKWVQMLNLIPQDQAVKPMLDVPAFEKEPAARVDAQMFLTGHAADFLDRGQHWHRELAYVMRHFHYDQLEAAELDREVQPEKVTEVDFVNLVQRERLGTRDDIFTLREQITRDRPRMISHCLDYIRKMDTIIKPYEELRTGRGETMLDDPEKVREMRVIDEISKRIVIETMVRGWPSVYLEDKEDQQAADAWAAEYRQKVWKILARQAKAQGVALDVLLEDNVVYDVRFDDDLGCLIQPLMLVDDATHAQLHGTRTGASVAVPLWPRRTITPLPAAALSLGNTNRTRAARLIEEARRLADGKEPDSAAIAAKLRNALSCHPAAAGKLLLAEWCRRLARDTSGELAQARRFIEGCELFSKRRYAEARTSVEQYMKEEPRPVPDAYVIAALCGLLYDDRSDREAVTKAIDEFNPLAEKSNRRVRELQARYGPAWQSPVPELALIFRQPRPSREEINEVMEMRTRLDTLQKLIESKTSLIKERDERRRDVLARGLRDPESVRNSYPSVALACERARELMEEAEQNDGMYAGGPGLLKYGDMRRVVEVRGLLDLSYALSVVASNLERNAKDARISAVSDVRKLAKAIWLPQEIESDLTGIADELSKGKGDRLQTLQLVAMLRQAVSTCDSRMQDLLSSTAIRGVPLRETIITRTHVTHTLHCDYRRALMTLFDARIAFGIATEARWMILDETLAELPDDAVFAFDAERGIISVRCSETTTPLLQAKELTPAEVAFVEETLEEHELPLRLPLSAPTAAEGLLAVEVTPRREWRAWRDAMQMIEPELIAALSLFGYEANLMADYAPSASAEAVEFERRMDELIPRDTPVIDRSWPNLGEWEKLAGPGPKRSVLRARFA